MDNDNFFLFNKQTQTITDYDVENGGTDVKIPDNIDGTDVLYIGDKAFFDKGLTYVELPDGLSLIGERAFDNNIMNSVVVNTKLRINLVTYQSVPVNILLWKLPQE